MTYKVPLIPPNLRKNETIVQIADSLSHLSKVMDDIMFHIENRIDAYSNKLNSISNRVDDVEAKVSQLRSVKNAVQVFSSSKYPAAEVDRRYTSMFPTSSEIEFIRHEVSDKYPLKKDEPLEKLHVYHVQLSKVEPDKIEGLGKIPNDVKCVNDLLLYNCGKNLYKEFTMSDSLRVSFPSTKAEENKIQIGIAPASIGDRTTFSNLSNQTYFYSPDLGEVPSLDIPLDLPDLPGIAGNIRYKDESDLGIAPSVAMSPSSPVSQMEFKNLNEDLEGLPEILPSTPSPPPVQEFEKAPMKVEVMEQKQEQVEIFEKYETNIEIQPQEPKTVLKKQETHNQVLPVIPDSRANLMEAIRQAGGGKKLKSVNKEESTSKSEKSGGDLMADLHAKLAMRRKGISGAQKNSGNASIDSRETLGLMSALIPAPEETNEESTDQDEEWE